MVVINTKFRAGVGLRDPITVEKPIEYVIHYLKSDSGAPVTNGALDEYCLNVADSILYHYDGTTWIPNNITNFDICFLFSDSGIANAGNGSNVPDMMIYQKEADGSFSRRYANDGVIVLIKNKSKNHDKNCLRVYNASDNDWKTPVTSTSGSGGYTQEEIEDIVANLLQEGEGIDLTYNDPTNTLTISCELAEAGNNTVNKGIANFDNENFNVSSGFVSITKIDGGNWI